MSLVYKNVLEKDVKILTDIVGSNNVLYKNNINEVYASDRLGTVVSYPEVVVVIESKNQVQEVMKYAYQENICVTVRGAGTGLVGGAVAVCGGILLDMSKMNKILELDPINLTLEVEPGVLLNDIYEIVEPEGLFYAPDPGMKFATIGGNISTNAGGMRAIKYGTTREWVRALEVVTPQGDLLKLGSKVVKNSTGYGLKDMIIGSEGTLAIIVSATLKLIPKPKYAKSLLVAFSSREDAIEASPKLIKAYVLPTAVEFFEKQSLSYSEAFFGQTIENDNYNAYLLLSYDGNDELAVQKDLEHVKDLLINEYKAVDAFIVDAQSKRSNIWNIRGGFLEAIKSSSDFVDECDVVLPRSNISKFLEHVRQVSEKMNIRIPYFGHIGDGNLHIYLCKDNASEEVWKKRVEEGFMALYSKAFELGGLVSGEHGIGIAKKHYMHQLLGEEQLEIMRGIKRTFDKKGILNPGKII